MIIPHGLSWLHCTGPDGPVVLLGDYDSRTGRVTLIDDGYTSWSFDGETIHKWKVYRAEPVARPRPAHRHGWVYFRFEMVRVHLDADSKWRLTSDGTLVTKGTDVYETSHGGSVVDTAT